MNESILPTHARLRLRLRWDTVQIIEVRMLYLRPLNGKRLTMNPPPTPPNHCIALEALAILSPAISKRTSKGCEVFSSKPTRINSKYIWKYRAEYAVVIMNVTTTPRRRAQIEMFLVNPLRLKFIASESSQQSYKYAQKTFERRIRSDNIDSCWGGKMNTSKWTSWRSYTVENTDGKEYWAIAS